MRLRRVLAIGTMSAAVAALGVVSFVAAAPAQDDPTDARLETASGARSVLVRLGGDAGGRVVELPLEVYVGRVLAGEGEPRAGTAAQQALAIAIRTYAAANAGRHGRDGFDLCDTTHCQVLRPSTPASRHAALTTASQFLTYEGRPAEVFYSASCGGRSEAASQAWAGGTDFPYLRVAVDDVHAGDEAWVLDVSLARVEQALRGVGFEGRRLTDVRIERRSESGRVTRLHLPGLRPDAIAGDDLRLALGRRELRSTRFTVQRTGRMLRFTGSGYGHGVGLCVVGAGRRAARGESVAAILAQYYPGLRLESFAPLAAASALAPTPGHERASALEPALGPATGHERAPALSPADTLARRVRGELAATLGIAQPPPVRLQIHDSLEAFRDATGRPWWVTVAVAGSTVDLAPLAMLEQRDGLDAFVRRGVAEVLMGETFAGRPAWVRVGGARYYASVTRPTPPKRAECPSDAELLMAVSAPAYRVAELRAEACFARALARTGDWRRVE